VVVQSLKILQGEELTGMEPCALKGLAESHQKDRLPPLWNKQNKCIGNKEKGVNLCFE
jgi:hypothetical protein